MQELKKTTPGENGHYHIVYINTETGIGGMSQGSDGSPPHELIYDPPREPTPEQPAIPPEIDPMTGQPYIDPNTGMPDQGQPAIPADPGKEVGTWMIAPDANGETHELTDYVTTSKKKKESDKEILDDCLSLWREALDLSRESKKRARESKKFYKGDQWEDGLKRDLNALDRAALTINEIAPNIDTLIGYQMEQRTDIRYLPQEGGDQRVADMYNVIIKKILDACYYQREETKVFKDVCIGGFGDFNVYMDFQGTIQGDIKVERFPDEDIDYGPHEKEDLSDCEYEVKSRMQSIAKLKQVYGKKANEIEESYKQYAGQYPDIDRGYTVDGKNMDYRNAKKIEDSPYTVDGTFPLVDVQKKQFRLVQCTRKTYVEVTVAFHQEENYFESLYDWKPEDLALVNTIPGFQSITQLKTRMRITRFCGTVILSDENPAELPSHDFHTIPVYAYRQDGEYWGKVESAKDPQREINKRRSQMMDTMNRLGASVYYIEPDTFKDDHEKSKFKAKRSRPGSIFDVTNIDRTPKLETGAELPQGLVQIMQLDQQNLQRLMNVVVEQAGANESGALFLEKKKGRLTGNQFIFDNLSFAKQRLGKLLLPLVQKYYPPERCERLLNAQNSQQKFQIGGQDYSQYSKDEIIEMLENSNVLDYDVVVAESAWSATTRQGIAKVLFELITQGASIPPEIPLEFLDIPQDIKSRITQQLQTQADADSAAATEAGNNELAKTVIAQGSYTIDPAKAQEIGLVPVNQGLPNPASNPNTENSTTAADIYESNLTSGLAG